MPITSAGAAWTLRFKLTLPTKYTIMARAALQERGHSQVFTYEKLQAKAEQWAAYWCRRAAGGSRRHTVFDDQARAKSIATRTSAADRRAQSAQRWRAAGRSAAWIADKLGCTRRTVFNLFKRVVQSVKDFSFA